MVKYWTQINNTRNLLVECVIPQVAVYGNKLQMQMMLMVNLTEYYIGITQTTKWYKESLDSQ